MLTCVRLKIGPEAILYN